MNITLIRKMIEEGYISRRKHSLHNLWILNYTPQTQFESKWNEATIMCRGLIVDAQWNIIGRPFKKFFTIDQLVTLRNHVHHLYGRKFKDIHKAPCITMEKIDGSLGIIYYNPFNSKWELATRGSFESDQAIEGNQILQQLYNRVNFTCGYTYMVEIVYPQNRIVVDYGNKRDLIFLAAINNNTGLDDWIEWGKITNQMSFAQTYPIYSFQELKTIPSQQNAEGFVLIFSDGFRLKFKFEEYKRLHHIMTGLTQKRIWECLMNGETLDLTDIPDELYQKIKTIQTSLIMDFAKIESEALEKLYDNIANTNWTRKQLALNLEDYKYKHIVFAMLDKHDYSKMIWQILKPESNDVKIS